MISLRLFPAHGSITTALKLVTRFKRLSQGFLQNTAPRGAERLRRLAVSRNAQGLNLSIGTVMRLATGSFAYKSHRPAVLSPLRALSELIAIAIFPRASLF
jgi:hypothetical protein